VQRRIDWHGGGIGRREGFVTRTSGKVSGTGGPAQAAPAPENWRTQASSCSHGTSGSV